MPSHYKTKMTLNITSLTLNLDRDMSYSQRYPLNICLIINDGDIPVFPTEHSLFSIMIKQHMITG